MEECAWECAKFGVTKFSGFGRFSKIRTGKERRRGGGRERKKEGEQDEDFQISNLVPNSSPEKRKEWAIRHLVTKGLEEEEERIATPPKPKKSSTAATKTRKKSRVWKTETVIAPLEKEKKGGDAIEASEKEKEKS